jgi:ribosomal protein L7/L12
MADEIEELKERIEKLESRMDFLMRRLGISLKEAPDWKASSKIIELVKKGDKKAAIREFMEESGASLKDAKTFIESIKA